MEEQSFSVKPLEAAGSTMVVAEWRRCLLRVRAHPLESVINDVMQLSKSIFRCLLTAG